MLCEWNNVSDNCYLRNKQEGKKERKKELKQKDRRS